MFPGATSSTKSAGIIQAETLLCLTASEIGSLLLTLQSNVSIIGVEVVSTTDVVVVCVEVDIVVVEVKVDTVTVVVAVVVVAVVK